MDRLLLRPLLPHNAARRTEVSAVLAEAVWEPSGEKLRQTMETYERDPGHRLYVRLGDGPEPEVAGVIGLRELAGTVEIRHLAVAPGRRGRGLGWEMVFALPTVCTCLDVVAETDRDAVGFYRRIGFSVESLGEVYPGTERFRCRLRLPEAVAAVASRYDSGTVRDLIVERGRAAGVSGHESVDDFPWEDRLAWVIVGYHRGQPAGYATVCLLPKLDRRKGFIYVDEIWVRPDFRRLGVARAILGCADALAEDGGLAGVRLYVASDNPAAQELYRRAGYTLEPSLFAEKLHCGAGAEAFRWRQD